MIENKEKFNGNTHDSSFDTKENKTIYKIAEFPEYIGEYGEANDLPDEIGEGDIILSKDAFVPSSQYSKDGKLYETDDNGSIYKINRKLLPNTTYELNDYTFESDGIGRPISAKGQLKLGAGNRDVNAQLKVGYEDRKVGDQGGHLIAARFGGPGGIENLVAMKAEINQGDYKKMENDLAKAALDGKNVNANIEVMYDGDSKRPNRILVIYTIDGEKTKRIFNNN